MLTEVNWAVPRVGEEQQPDQYSVPAPGRDAETGADRQEVYQKLGRPEYVVKIGVLSSHGAPWLLDLKWVDGGSMGEVAIPIHHLWW